MYKKDKIMSEFFFQTKNPVIKDVKENDIVLFELPANNRGNYIQICRVYNLNYEPSDEEYDFDWLYFDAEVLFVNLRMHKKHIVCIGNCLAIKEIIPFELVNKYVKLYDLWKPEENTLSDAEFQREVEKRI